MNYYSLVRIVIPATLLNGLSRLWKSRLAAAIAMITRQAHPVHRCGRLYALPSRKLHVRAASAMNRGKQRASTHIPHHLIPLILPRLAPC